MVVSRQPCASTAAALALLLTFFAPGAATRAASPAGPRWVPGRILIVLAPEADQALTRRPDATFVPPTFLADAGITSLRPAAPGLAGRSNRLAVRLGLDRIYLASITDGADPVKLCARLQTDPRVVHAHPDYIGGGGGQPLPVADDTAFNSQWHLNNVGQTGGTPGADMDVVEAWRVTIGHPETLVAVLDTGIDGDHREFLGRIARGGADFVHDDFDPEADHNHGTRVAGLIGAVANNRFAVAGVDQAAALLPIKILDQDNLGSTSDLAAGLRHAADAGADIANLSLIRYPNTATLRLAVEYAHAAGVLLIGCNGNDGIAEPNYPASYPEVLATGWTDDDDRRASLSNFTPTLDVVAPGAGVLTVIHDSTINGGASFFGCSAATPNTAGVAALLLALDPTLTQAQLADILRSTADDEVGLAAEDVPGRDDYHGWGRVNADRALRSLGLTSAGRIHVHDVTLARSGNATMAARVTVLDDLNGVEPGVAVEGLITPPDEAPAPLSGTTGPGGIAVLSWTAPGALPAGAYGFEVTSVALEDHTRDAAADRRTSVMHDPGLNALHVAGLWSRDAYSTLTVDVLVADDDGFPEDAVDVSAILTAPGDGSVPAVASSRGAAGGVARFVFTSAGDFAPGDYLFEVTSLTKPGFVHQADADVDAGVLTHTVADRFSDADGDGIVHAADNCRDVPNADQADTDEDGIGDVCDACADRFDPAQRDADGDGVGDRCDCAPWDATRTTATAVLTLRLDRDGLAWQAVAGADRYDVTRRTLHGLDFDPVGPCLADNVIGSDVADADTPLPGTGFAYLVRADDATCGPGPYAPASSGAPRIDIGPGACD